MAYTNTGLGWYANNDWLTDTPGTIGRIASGTPSGCPIVILPDGYRQIDGVCATDSSVGIVTDIPASSVTHHKVYFLYTGPVVNNAWGYGAWESNMDFQGPGFYNGWRFDFCGTQLCSLNYDQWYVYEQHPPNVGILDGVPLQYTTGPLTVTNRNIHIFSSNNVSISDRSFVLAYLEINSHVFVAAKRINDGICGLYDTYTNEFLYGNQAGDIIEYGTYTEFSKSASGYSVTCMCKWKAELGGDVYCSPVLISSLENNTLYTRNSATPSVPATQHTFQGMTFYMRKAPLDVVDGSETITSNFPVLDYSDSPPVTNDMLFALIASASELGVGPVPEDDPYSGAGESGPDAGDPTFDFTSEDIPVPSIPSIGAYNTGFINMYKPTLGDLQGLAHYLWSGSFDPENLRKLIANPMDAILGLHIVPTTASHPAGSSATLYVGNIDTQLSMLRLTEQYYELDCGTINIEPKWGAYLDYAPYSKLTLYLPYIGFVPISPDDCMGGSINVKYHVDVLSGACCVYVYCTSNRGADSHVLYSYTGACACDCPVTEGQYTNAILGILNIAGSVAGAISGAMTGNAGGITGGIESAANAALSMVKPDISRSGSFGGSAGLMGIQYPYLVLTVPRMCTPGDQQKQEGYPSFVTKAMGQLAGLNQVQVKRLEGMTCTANETEEILTLLEGGAIF